MAIDPRVPSPRHAWPLIVACLLASCLIASCDRPAADRTAAHASSAGAASAHVASATAAEKPRITGGPQRPGAVGAVAYVASGTSPLAAGCDGTLGSGVLYAGAEVEPHLAMHPDNPHILVGAWQQDRWSNGSARALVAATSLDGGRSWIRTPLPFSRCGGGNVLNGGDYERASDPWVSYSPNGVVHAMSLSTTGGAYQPGSANAMLASRSFDHGRTWTAPATLIRDSTAAFNDKNAITADPFDAAYVYAVWDRLIAATDRGPTYFARSTNGGASWEPARAIYDPGTRNQTIGNIVAVLPGGMLVNVFNRIDNPLGGPQRARVTVIRSTDRGATWSAPIDVAELLAVGTRDPVSGLAVRDGAIVPTIAAGPGGELYVAWQDSRFSAGVRDGIALSRSNDGGLSWSTPVRVNGAPGVPAFTPSLHVAADGTVGVSYYDLRSDTATAPLSTDAWLARSRDGGATWTDLRIGDTFDLTTAPFANGLFVGDYTGLADIDGRFVPFHARTTAQGEDNLTDVVAVSLAKVPALAAAQTPAAKRAEIRARQAPPGFVPDHRLRMRVDANLRRRLKAPPVPGEPARWMPHYATLALLQR